MEFANELLLWVFSLAGFWAIVPTIAVLLAAGMFSRGR
jgi:hypothetical protein